MGIPIFHKCFPLIRDFLRIYRTVSKTGHTKNQRHAQNHGISIPELRVHRGAPQCVRLNFATSPEILEQGLQAMRRAVQGLNSGS